MDKTPPEQCTHPSAEYDVCTAVFFDCENCNYMKVSLQQISKGLSDLMKNYNDAKPTLKEASENIKKLNK